MRGAARGGLRARPGGGLLRDPARRASTRRSGKVQGWQGHARAMAQSKRPRKAGRKEPQERLDVLNLAVNAALVFVAAPVLLVLAGLLWMGRFGGTENNEHLFLGAVSILVAVFFLVLSGLKVAQHVKARRRFAELLEGAQKSAVMRNLDELATLARAMGPRYRQRLDARLDELGIRR